MGGFERFVADLRQLSISVIERGPLAIYRIVPLTGVFAGTELESAVAISELDKWHSVAPHWIHTPVNIPSSNQQPSEGGCGWWRYSRPFPGRIDASDAPGREWIAHVRLVLAEATL